MGSLALELFNKLENSERVAGAHQALGEMAIAKGNLEEARLHYEANLKYFASLGDQVNEQYYRECLRSLAAV